jgi:fluoroacetyl-CoA thioesterase
MSLEIGLSGAVTIVVSNADTAVAMGSGSVDVLATPRVVALVEQATCAAVADHLDPACTTVGVRVELDHLRPTPVGSTVTAEAILEEIRGRKLTFVVSATDTKGEVAVGKVTRIVVEVERFMGTAR